MRSNNFVFIYDSTIYNTRWVDYKYLESVISKTMVNICLISFYHCDCILNYLLSHKIGRFSAHGLAEKIFSLFHYSYI